ncbi:hypothetical protein NKH57_20400 [Mesorhizobium sp. M1050]|uniref:hypothetical protein n=1 Tax=Mesorhizobium sp. M1050 TaxID=2957051 RepID=UPI003339A500
MTHPRAWRGIGDPAHLFLALWRYLNAMERERLSSAVDVPPTLSTALAAALAIGDAAKCIEAFCDALEGHWDESTHWRARRERASVALTAMRAIDEVMLAVHPRTIVPTIRLKPLPVWLDDVRERRTIYGTFASDAQLSLIARGPFARSPKLPFEESTFVLGDQFAALKVIDLSAFIEDGRQLQMSIKVVDQSADRGVPHRSDRAASEVVSFVPLAEVGGDLVASVTTDGATTFIDVLKGAAFDAAKRFLNAVHDCADSDIFVAPELTVDAADITRIAAGLSAMSGSRPRLLVSGSGLVPGNPAKGGQPFNQATMLNGNGATLWQHQKVSAYAMLEETSKGLKIDGAEGMVRLMERISWSSSITVADLDGLGRCIVLICQDMMMGVVHRLLDEFRPDWLIVPILDTGTSLQRWPARRARELAPTSEARFVVVSSLTMKEWQVDKYPGEEMGVAIGPTYTNRSDPDEPPALQIEVAPESSSRRHGSVRWRAVHGWQKYR